VEVKEREPVGEPELLPAAESEGREGELLAEAQLLKDALWDTETVLQPELLALPRAEEEMEEVRREEADALTLLRGESEAREAVPLTEPQAVPKELLLKEAVALALLLGSGAWEELA